MLHFVDVSKSYMVNGRPKVILAPTSLTIAKGARIGILGRNGAGKSTLLRMIAGQEEPDSGRIVRTASISWPLGFSGGFHDDLTGAENVVFLARIHGADPDATLAYVAEFAELGDYLHQPVRTFSTGMRAKLGFGVSLAIDFDCYLIDEVTAVGDRWFQKKARCAFENRTRYASIIIVSHNPSTIREYCDAAAVLRDGDIFIFSSISLAEQFYERS